ncbi:MAG: HD domain-containing protein [Candidatus Helarchaeota archaeon]|nr:HD domain-containing protein [Candidatus Helarchaeota archaeon]
MKEVLRWPVVQKLRLFSSHQLQTPFPAHNRLQHSIRIAFLAYKLSKFFFQDPSNCTRAGLLHDIGYATVSPEFTQTHFFNHARAGFYLLTKFNEPKWVREAARTHMFPMGAFPKTILSFVIWLADKLDWIFYLTRLDSFLDRYINNILKINKSD